MIERRFHKPGKPPARPTYDPVDAWPAVYYFDRSRHTDVTRDSGHDVLLPFKVRWWIPPSSTGADFETRDEALAKFDQMVASLEKKGWRETEWSWTRRTFGHPSAQRPTKFWAVALDGATLTVQFGKVRPGRPGTMGTTKPKAFPTSEAARAAYDKLIAAKRAEKYREIMPRDVPATGSKSTPAAAKRKSPPTARRKERER